MAEPTAAQPLVYGGTPQVKEAFEGTAWPRVYRERNEIQELGFKRMMDHGGLDSTHGRKTIMGPDRHHQRKKEPLAQSLETAHERVTKTAAAVTAQQAQGGRVRGPGAWHTSGAAPGDVGDLGTRAARRQRETRETR